MASVGIANIGPDLGAGAGGGMGAGAGAGIGGGDGGLGGGGMEAELGGLLRSTVDGIGGDDAGDDAAALLGGDGTGSESDGLQGQPGQSEQADLNSDPNAPPDQPDLAQEPLPGWKLNADGTGYTVAPTELPRIQAALQYNEAVSQLFQTPQEAQESYATSSQMRQMQNDWKYGTPESIRSVAEFLSGAGHQDPAGRMAFQRSFGQFAQMLPDMLRQTNPAGYNQMVQSFGPRIWEPLYQRAAQVVAQFGPESSEAKLAIQQAQGVQWGMTGQYPTQLPKFDPQSQAQTAFQQREAAFNQRQSAAIQRDTGNFQSAIEQIKNSELDRAILAKLAPVKDRYPEVAFNDLVAGIRGEIMNTLEGQDNLHVEHRQERDALIQDYQATWHRGSPGQGLQPRVQAYQQSFLNRANRVLGPIAQKRINATTQARVNANGPRRTANAGNPGNGANAGANRQNSPNGNGRTNGMNGQNGQNGQNGRNGAPNGAPPRTRTDQFDDEWSRVFTPFRSR